MKSPLTVRNVGKGVHIKVSVSDDIATIRNDMLKTLLLVLLLAAPAFAAELYPNDLKKDSAPAIVEHMRVAKTLPPGVYYVHQTLKTGTGVGGGLVGTGSVDFARCEGAFAKHAPGSTVIVDARPKENTEPLLLVQRGRFRVENIALVGCLVWLDYREKGLGPIVTITQNGAEWPVGTTTLHNVNLHNSEIGILHADTPGTGGHCDHTRFTNGVTSWVDYPILVDDNQSVDHYFDFHASGDGKYLIWCKDGGKIRGTIHTDMHWERYLVVGDAEKKTFPTKNNGYFNLAFDFDGADSCEAFYEEKFASPWSRPIVLLTGFAASDWMAKKEPIVLNRSKVRIRIERDGAPYVWKSGAAEVEDAAEFRRHLEAAE